jgi:hypothetical protein
MNENGCIVSPKPIPSWPGSARASDSERKRVPAIHHLRLTIELMDGRYALRYAPRRPAMTVLVLF